MKNSKTDNFIRSQFRQISKISFTYEGCSESNIFIDIWYKYLLNRIIFTKTQKYNSLSYVFYFDILFSNIVAFFYNSHTIVAFSDGSKLGS